MWAPPPPGSAPAATSTETESKAGQLEDGMVVFEIEGGEDDGDELWNWFGEDAMQAVEVCRDACSSASEGLIFRGFAGDSANCTSSEESNMEWNDMEQTPLQTPPRTPQGALPKSQQVRRSRFAAQRKSCRVQPAATG
eukprot:g11625.t1